MRSVVALIFNLSVAWVVIGGNSVALAQSGNLRSSFGMTLNKVAVTSVDFYAGSVSASSDLIASVGWQYTLEHRRDRALGVLTDVEAQLGLVERNAASVMLLAAIILVAQTMVRPFLIDSDRQTCGQRFEGASRRVVRFAPNTRV
jgi:hypothetical protein